jgi:hypothetical protein
MCPVSSRSPRAYVHIGPPKTGTTYLQTIIWRNRKRLAGNGVQVPLTERAHFYAALDLRDMDFRGHDNPVRRGAWSTLAAAVDKAPGGSVSLVSHELFAGAAEAQIARLADDLGPAQVHVVYGARDLARQLPAMWQESVKIRSQRTYDDYLAQAMRQLRTGKTSTGFWRAQHQPATLARWATRIPADRIHVVTIPQRGGGQDLLWQRFCAAIGIDPDGYTPALPTANPSLSAEETEVLRLVNQALPPSIPWPTYERLVKGRFNERADNGSPGTPLTVPEHLRDEILDHTEAVKKELASAGYDIVGSLDDLDPAATTFGPSIDFESPRVTAAAAALLARELTRPSGRPVSRTRTPRRVRQFLTRHLPPKATDRLRRWH